MEKMELTDLEKEQLNSLLNRDKIEQSLLEYLEMNPLINIPHATNIIESLINHLAGNHIAGDFVRHVADGNYIEAMSHADHINRNQLFVYEKWMVNNLPYTVYHKRKGVKMWGV